MTSADRNTIVNNTKGTHMKTERIAWLDYGKGICMLCVILFHTWAIYVNDGKVILDWIEPFFLTLFFFISGYLTNLNQFNAKKDFISIVKRLLLPYFVFTSIIWLPKSIAHDTDITFRMFLINILGGYASWFIAALIIAKLLLNVILNISKSLKWIWLCTLVSILIGLTIFEFIPYKTPWYLGEGMICLFYVTLGLTYKKYESQIKPLSIPIIIFLAITYLLLMGINRYIHTFEACIYQMRLGHVVLSHALCYVLVSILAIAIIINILKRLPKNMTWLSYIGQNSLIFYYLNSGVLVSITILLQKIGLEYNGNIIMPILIYLIDISLHYCPVKADK